MSNRTASESTKKTFLAAFAYRGYEMDHNVVLAQENVTLRLALEAAYRWMYLDTADFVRSSCDMSDNLDDSFKADVYQMRAGWKILHPGAH